jgi:hypothetical protein
LVQRRENSAAAQEKESPGSGQEDEDARQQQEGQEIPAQGTGLDQFFIFYIFTVKGGSCILVWIRTINL